MKNAILLFTLFLSVTSIYCQKKFPEPKKSIYIINKLGSNVVNGPVLSNLRFKSEVRLKSLDIDKYEWRANVNFVSCELEGYNYEGVFYSKIELENTFEINLEFFLATLKDVYVNFDRDVVSFNYLPEKGIGQEGQINYSKYSEDRDFNITEVKIFGNYRDKGFEAKIKFALNKEKTINTKKGNSTAKKTSNSKSSSKSKGGRLAIKSNKTNDNKTNDNKNRSYENDAAAVSRRLAKYRKQEAARKKREFEKSVNRTTKSLGKVFSAGISSLVDGEGSLKFVYGIRNIEGDQPIMSPLGASTLEIGAGFGRIGLSVGYSLVDNQSELDSDSANRRERAFGGTWAFGLDLTIFKFDFLSSDADFGINGEYGFGNLDFQVSTATSDFSTDYSTSFYGIGAQLRFLNFLYVTYGYGKFTTEATRITASGSSDFEPENGFYTKLGFGVKYDFGY